MQGNRRLASSGSAPGTRPRCTRSRERAALRTHRRRHAIRRPRRARRGLRRGPRALRRARTHVPRRRHRRDQHVEPLGDHLPDDAEKRPEPMTRRRAHRDRREGDDDDEVRRLQSIALTGLSNAPDPTMDRLAGLAARLLGADVGLVSLVDDHRQFFPGQLGLPAPIDDERETPLAQSLCRTVVQRRDVLQIDDMTADGRVGRARRLHRARRGQLPRRTARRRRRSGPRVAVRTRTCSAHAGPPTNDNSSPTSRSPHRRRSRRASPLPRRTPLATDPSSHSPASR